MCFDFQFKVLVFCFFFKCVKSIFLEFGVSLDILIFFVFDIMQLYEVIVIVIIYREDFIDIWSGDYFSMMSMCMVNDFYWIYFVRGIFEFFFIKEFQVFCIECKVWSCVEERVEVLFIGLVFNFVGVGIGWYLSVILISLLGCCMFGELEYGVDYFNVLEEFRYVFGIYNL